MSEDTRRILEMLSEGKITIEEAERLLQAVADASQGTEQLESDDPSPLPKYLRVIAEDNGSQESFNLKIPLSLIRAGIKLKALIPDEARERTVEGLHAKGIDFDPFELPADQVDDFIRTFSELEVEANGSDGHFRLYME